MQWIWLWRTPRNYVAGRSIWANRWTQFVFRDDRKTNYDSGNWHEPRVPQKLWLGAKRLDSIKVIHYARMAPHRSRARDCRLRILELLQGRNAEEINRQYAITREHQPMALADLPTHWVDPWLELGLDLLHFDDPELNWFDLDILEHFARHGSDRFADLNIWDIDWERRRLLAVAAGYQPQPASAIVDPRTREQRLYHAYLDRFGATPPWRDRRAFARPFWRMAQRCGLRREHVPFLFRGAT